MVSGEPVCIRANTFARFCSRTPDLPDQGVDRHAGRLRPDARWPGHDGLARDHRAELVRSLGRAAADHAVGMLHAIHDALVRPYRACGSIGG